MTVYATISRIKKVVKHDRYIDMAYSYQCLLIGMAGYDVQAPGALLNTSNAECLTKNNGITIIYNYLHPFTHNVFH